MKSKNNIKTLDQFKMKHYGEIGREKRDQLDKTVNIIFDSPQSEEIVSLSSEQIEMLLMSEKDIQTGKFISESELNKCDHKLFNKLITEK
jgi:hypothetical protein